MMWRSLPYAIPQSRRRPHSVASTAANATSQPVRKPCEWFRRQSGRKRGFGFTVVTGWPFSSFR